MKLSDLKSGDRCVVAAVSGGRLRARLISMGIKEGTALKVIRGATRFGGVIVEGAGATVALRTEAANSVEVSLG